MSDLTPPPPVEHTGIDLQDAPRHNDLLFLKVWIMTNIGKVVTGCTHEHTYQGGWFVTFRTSPQSEWQEMPLDDFLDNVKPNFPFPWSDK